MVGICAPAETKARPQGARKGFAATATKPADADGACWLHASVEEGSLVV
jgi:hypothetical protein